MKKKLIALCLFFAYAYNVHAQEQGYKPEQGDITAEFVFLGGLLNTELGLNSNLLRFRYFVSERLAARVGIGIGASSEIINVADDPANPTFFGEIKGSYTQFGINLGLERHFEGTERLSPYVGGDILLAFTSVRERGSNVTPGGSFEEGSSYTRKGQVFLVDIDAPDAGNAFGARLVGGADFYIFRRLFVGAEFGFGFLATSLRDLELTRTVAGTPFTVTTDRGARTDVSSSVIGNFRLGFAF